MKRTLSLILTLALVLGAMLAIIPTAEEAAAPAGSIEISQANVQFGNSVYLLIAVDYTDAYATAEEAKANVTISVDGKTLTPDESVEAPEGTVGFKYTDLGAKNMGDVSPLPHGIPIVGKNESTAVST